MKKHLVVFQPSGKQGYVPDGTTLTEAARQVGVAIETICGRQHTCGKCIIHIEDKAQRVNLSPVSENERQVLERHGAGEGDRLGCIAAVHGGVAAFVPESSRAERQVAHKAIAARHVRLKPAVRNYYVELTPPTTADPAADWERLAAGLAARFGLRHLTIDYTALHSLPEALRQGGWKATATVWMGREVIGIRPGLVQKSCGLAVDIGTTTIAGYLCDLDGGSVIASASLLNPQTAFGEDVISRIAYCDANPEGLDSLHRAVIGALNQLAQDLTARAGLKTGDIMEAVLVGNTAMHHLALNIPPASLGKAPFTPVLQDPLDIKARETGLDFHPGANVHVLPVEAGFVGADNVAVLLALAPHRQEQVWLIIDIGTNGELVLGNRHRLLCGSCAAGPALEGGKVRAGMRAAPGAIERVRIDPHSWEVRFRVVGQEGWSDGLPDGQIQARGICGSGVIEAVAGMTAAGIIDKSGRFSQQSHPRLRNGEFVIARSPQTAAGKGITLSRSDIQEIALAKAAIYAASKVLLGKLGLERPQRVILAGAFGSLIDPQHALAIGLFPNIDLKHVRAAGNAAGEGARLALLNVDRRAEARRLARRIEHVEFTREAGFAEEFTHALYFPHMRDSFPHLEQDTV